MRVEEYLKKIGLNMKDAESIFGEIIQEYTKCCLNESQDIIVKNNLNELNQSIINLMNSKEGQEEIQKYAKKRKITLSGEEVDTSIDLEFDPIDEEWEINEEEDWDLPIDIYDDLEEEEPEVEVEPEVEPEPEVEVEPEAEPEPEVEVELEVEPEPEVEVELEVEPEPEVEVEPEAEPEPEVEPEPEPEPAIDEPEVVVEEDDEEEEPPIMGSVDEEEEEEQFEMYSASVTFEKIGIDVIEYISNKMLWSNNNFIAREVEGAKTEAYIWQIGVGEMKAMAMFDLANPNKLLIYSYDKTWITASLIMMQINELEKIKIEGENNDRIKDLFTEQKILYLDVDNTYNYQPYQQPVISPSLIHSLLSLSFSDIIYMLRLYDYQRIGKDKGLLTFGVENCVPKDYPKYLWNNFSMDVNKGFDDAKVEMVQIELVEEGLIADWDDNNFDGSAPEGFKAELTQDGFMLCEFILTWIFPKGTTNFASTYYPEDLLYYVENTYVAVADDTTLYGNSAFMEIGGEHLDSYLVDNSKETIKESAGENENSAYYKERYDTAVETIQDLKYDGRSMYSEMGYKFPFVIGKKGENKLVKGMDFGKEFLPQTVAYKGNTIGSSIFSKSNGMKIVVDTGLINYFKKYYGEKIGLITLDKSNQDSLFGVIANFGAEDKKIVGLIKGNGKDSSTNPCIMIGDNDLPDYLALYSQDAFIEQNKSLTQLKSWKDVAMEIPTPNPMSELLTKSAEEISDKEETPKADTDIKAMLERKIKSRKMLLEDMQDEGADKSAIKKLMFKIELYEDQLEEFNQ